MKDNEDEDEELYKEFEPLFTPINKARFEGYEISREYEIRLYRLYEAIEEKIEKVKRVSSEKSEKLKELVIPKLVELIKLTRPNVVDNIILKRTTDYIKYNIRPEDPEPDYVNTLQKTRGGLDLLLKVYYDLQKIYWQIRYRKLTPQSFYQYLKDMREFAYKIDPKTDEEDIEFAARKVTVQHCIEETVYDLFEHPDKHQRLIEEGRYSEAILNEFCNKY
jgi:hypothetical protein